MNIDNSLRGSIWLKSFGFRRYWHGKGVPWLPRPLPPVVVSAESVFGANYMMRT